MVIRRQTNIIHIVFIVIRNHIIIIIIVVSTAPRIPPHHPSQRRERSGAMGSVDQLLKSRSCLVVKLFGVLSCLFVE